MKKLQNGLIRKIYSEFFYVPKYGKIKEKVMLTHAVTAVTVIVTCLVAMGITAYAYFSCSITSSVGMLQAAKFSVQVTVSDEGSDPITPAATQDRTQTFRLVPGLYTVQLSKGDGTSGTGFCIVTVDGIAYHTQQLGTDVTAENGVREQVVFQLNVLQETEFSVESSWGTSANYTAASSQYIENSQPLQVITSNGPTDSSENTNETNATHESAPAGTVHTVAEGEVLGAIAERYGTTVESLIACNALADPDRLSIGQQIKIPPVEG